MHLLHVIPKLKMFYSKSIEYLFEEGGGLVFGQTLFLIQVMLQVTPVTKLGRDEDRAVGLEGADEAYHILVFAGPEHIDFRLH